MGQIAAHEQITEEIIPRSDLVFFVTCIDRPFSESERAFLAKIHDWRRKIVVVVNKVDLLDSRTKTQDLAKVAFFPPSAFFHFFLGDEFCPKQYAAVAADGAADFSYQRQGGVDGETGRTPCRVSLVAIRRILLSPETQRYGVRGLGAIYPSDFIRCR
jgi:hypothetical protein